MRAGTENLPGIVGLAKAIELLKTELPEAGHRMALLRDKLEAGLMQKVNPVVVNGIGPRICNTTNLSFPGDQGEDLLIALDMAGIAVSHGSACSSGALEPSRVLTKWACPHIAKSAIRFSLSRNTTHEEIDRAIEMGGQSAFIAHKLGLGKTVLTRIFFDAEEGSLFDFNFELVDAHRLPFGRRMAEGLYHELFEGLCILVAKLGH